MDKNKAKAVTSLPEKEPKAVGDVRKILGCYRIIGIAYPETQKHYTPKNLVWRKNSAEN